MTARKIDEKFNDKNYRRTVKNLHDAGWKHIHFTYADVDMLGHVCGVSVYTQLYNQHSEKFQVLPCPYLGSFQGGNGEKITK